VAVDPMPRGAWTDLAWLRRAARVATRIEAGGNPAPLDLTKVIVP
jgi:hypothetical protein